MKRLILTTCAVLPIALAGCASSISTQYKANKTFTAIVQDIKAAHDAKLITDADYVKASEGARRANLIMRKLDDAATNGDKLSVTFWSTQLAPELNTLIDFVAASKLKVKP